jgi:hypothetical protein
MPACLLGDLISDVLEEVAANDDGHDLPDQPCEAERMTSIVTACLCQRRQVSTFG